jgi:MoaA/NifB/PqqE/SkfB family radical SAM enzyme
LTRLHSARLHNARKKVSLFSNYIRRKPVWCMWQVTYRCNFRCAFCSYWKYEVDRDSELSPQEFEIGARKLKQIGTMMISLAGGEPLLRDDLPDIVRALSPYHFVFVTTNGWLMTPEKARALYDAGVYGVSVSIDFADPKKHDERRGTKGAHKRALNALKALSEARTKPYQRVNLNCVLMHDNLDELEDLIILAKRHGALFMVQPYGKLKTGDEEFLPRDPVGERLSYLSEKYRHFISNPEFLRRFDDHLSEGIPGCRAGQAFFNIDSYGNVAKCVEFSNESVGNIMDDDVHALIDGLNERHRTNRCAGCWYNCRGEMEILYTWKGARAGLPRLIRVPNNRS